MSQPLPPRRDLNLDLLQAALVAQWRTWLAFFVTVLFVALLGTLLLPRKYQATALIQLMPRAGQELAVTEVIKLDEGGYLEGRDRARTQLQIILSHKVGAGVLEAYKALGYTDLEPSPEGIEQLRKAMYVGPREDTQLVEISVQHRRPEQAAILANLTAQVYARVNLQARTDAAQQTLVWLDTQIQSYRTQLLQAQQAAMAFKESNGLINIDESVDGISTRISALQAALGEAATQRVLLETRTSQHDEVLARGDYEVLAGMFQDPVLQALSTSYATVSTEAAELSARYGDQHPEFQRAQARVKRVQGLIARQVRRQVQAERSSVQTLLQQEMEINAELTRIKTELLEKQRLQSQYAELKITADRTQQLYDSLLARRMEVDLQARSTLNDVQLVDAALVPSGPASPNLKLNLLVALAVGLGGGLGLALLRHRLDDSVWTEEELSAPLLTHLPTISGPTLADRCAHLLQQPFSPHSEAVRRLRSALLSIPFSGKCRRLVVTSCAPGE
ncbi:MAG TPA: GumC family protein, partial [Myxococcota bacterium]|nr:GumC family protein [Myxococcota bacterium]